MKKMLIGALVGGLILFIWQFLSFGPLNLHGSQMEYTPNQDSILQNLSANLSEGTYFMPRAPHSASTEDQQKLYEENIGQPWAVVSYHEKLEMNRNMNMFRGFVVDVVSVFLLCWILLKFATLDFKTSIMSSIAIGLIGYLTINYLDSIWFLNDSVPDLIDAFVQWGLVGAWLGWWLPRQ